VATGTIALILLILIIVCWFLYRFPFRVFVLITLFGIAISATGGTVYQWGHWTNTHAGMFLGWVQHHL